MTGREKRRRKADGVGESGQARLEVTQMGRREERRVGRGGRWFGQEVGRGPVALSDW